MVAKLARDVAERQNGKITYQTIIGIISSAASDGKYSVSLAQDPTTEAWGKLAKDGYEVRGVAAPYEVSW